MQKKARCIDVATPDGKVILSLYLHEKEVNVEDNPKKYPEQQGAKTEKNKGNGSQSDDSLMTDAQKRYLFRILADQGIEGDKAHEKLKGLFQVETLKEVTKLEASKVIERLLEEKKEGREHAGSPF